MWFVLYLRLTTVWWILLSRPYCKWQQRLDGLNSLTITVLTILFKFYYMYSHVIRVVPVVLVYVLTFYQLETWAETSKPHVWSQDCLCSVTIRWFHSAAHIYTYMSWIQPTSATHYVGHSSIIYHRILIDIHQLYIIILPDVSTAELQSSLIYRWHAQNKGTCII